MSDTAKRYIEQVLHRIAAPQSQIDRLRADLEGHFTAGAEGGEPPHDVIRRLGTPEEVAASFMDGVELRYAGFWERVAAFFGDLGLGLLVLIPFGLVCALLQPTLERESVASTALLVVIGLVGLSLLGLAILYFPVLEHLYGRTFGKFALRLRVVDEHGAPIGWGAAFIRRITFFFDIFWLDALFVPFTARKQRAFDIVAKTMVIREPDHARTAGSWLLLVAPWVVVALSGAVVALIVPS